MEETDRVSGGQSPLLLLTPFLIFFFKYLFIYLFGSAKS